MAKRVDTVLFIRHLVFFQPSAGGVSDTGEVQFVTSNGDAYAMRFSLLGPNNLDKASVRELAHCRDIAAPHGKNCVGAGWYASADSLS